ncbi:CKLF-like MARVEL transmembrane domain-containing protein 6 [Elgaria multicarinata webbii]|uniref:CKLF-like MARVEL transmembrane domain-containing protein 6 n=1 Tax=Elgaria multicarinata webbii TaxID=159646 RepID=UPI002FCCDC51
MDNEGKVYAETTVPAEQPASKRPTSCGFTIAHLGRPRFFLKVLQLGLSFLAFLLEEVVNQCTMCGGLYFFEFVSCCALLLSILILILYCLYVHGKTLHDKIGKNNIAQLDFWITSVVGACFLLASIVFSATSDKSPIETAALVFGYFASVAFVVDAGQMFRQQCKAKTERQENTASTQNVTENQPLNNQQV